MTTHTLLCFPCIICHLSRGRQGWRASDTTKKQILIKDEPSRTAEIVHLSLAKVTFSVQKKPILIGSMLEKGNNLP